MSENNNRVLGVITARGGSKKLPRKNILVAGGSPLIYWTISAALQSELIDRVILSSDDDEIITVTTALGCEVPFKRPAELASDTATSVDVVLHAVDQVPGYEFVVLLQPTSPLRTAKDIDAAISLLRKSGAPSCVSVCEADQSPYWMYLLTEDFRLRNLLPPQEGFTRRQNLPPVYVLNGAIYVARVDWLRVSRSFVGEGSIAYSMPRERSIDIDDADDFEAFKARIESLHSHRKGAIS